MSYCYESYFDQNIDYDDDELGNEMSKRSHDKFYRAGFSDAESKALISSGYCVLMDDIVIDRFYGGKLSSFDFKTRFPLKGFRRHLREVPNNLPMYSAQSLADFHRHVETLRSVNRAPLLFRGQTGHYPLQRQVPNPAFVQAALGETSLLPSVWRRILATRKNVLHRFRDLTMFEWSKVIYDLFDVQGVINSERELGLFPGSFEADELPDHPAFKLVREFHEHRNAFLNAYSFGSGTALLTLLQHYGLFSPVLDLTSDPDVALFFATHKFSRDGGLSCYRFIGTNDRKAIVYVLRKDPNETLEYERGKMLQALDPQRPKRQACVVMPTNEYAMNLAGDFLVAAISLDFDLTEPGVLTPEHLFPSETDDLLLGAFKRNLRGKHRAALTEFF